MSDNKLKEDNNFTPIDYLYLIAKHRKLIIINFIVFCLIASVYSLVMPKTYKAHAVVMPPSGTSTGLLGQLPTNLPIGNISGMLGGGGVGELNTYLAILNSRTIAARTIHNFNLENRYGGATFDEILYSFRQNQKNELNEDGTITVSMTTTTEFFHPESDEIETRKLCAQITNYMVRQLDSINTSLKTEEAKYNRIFIEKRYEQNKRDLRNVENAMKQFEEKYGVISLPDQVSAAIDAAAALKKQIVMAEIEYKVLTQTMNQNNPNVIQKRIQLNELQKNLNQLKVNQNDNSDSLDIFPAFESAPKLGMEYLRLQREIKVQNTLYEFLTQQYEQAKLQEAKDTPTVQVIDQAIAPIKRSKPSRKMLVILVGLISILFSVSYVLFIEYLDNLKAVDERKYHRLIFALKSINIFKSPERE